MKTIKYFVILLLFIACENVQAQWNIMSAQADSLAMSCLDDIYNMKFQNSWEKAKLLQADNPKHPIGYFLESINLWWKIMIYPDSKKFDQAFLKSIDAVIYICNKELETNPWDLTSLFFKGGCIGYRGRYYSQRESWLNAGLDGQAALKILESCLQLAPSNRDVLLGIGYYKYFAEMLPQKYPALKPLMTFAPKGDRRLGLAQLKSVAKYAKYSGLEAKVILLQAYYMFEKDMGEVFSMAEELHQKYPNNPYFHRYLGRACVSLGKFDRFETLWMEILKLCKNKKEGYDNRTAREAMFYCGTALFYRDKFSRSLSYFQKCDEVSTKLDKEVSGFRIQANLKIGKIYDKLNMRSKAIEHYKKVMSWEDNNGSRKEAAYYLKAVYGS
jgi:tetratricopeptide (TPR) repeat protein